jgi:thioredoxin-related protein
MKDQYRATLDRARREDKRVALGSDAISKQYGLDELPVTIVFDRAGKQVRRFEGFTAEDALLAVVEQSL